MSDYVVNRWFVLLAGLALASLDSLRAADDKPPVDLGKLPPAAKVTIDFQRDIQPILTRACLACHGPARHKGGLRLDQAAEALKGGNSGPVIKAGDSAHSRLIQLVAGLDPDAKRMPLKGEVLTAAEIGRLRAWIDQGAQWPKDLKLVAAAQTKSNHWAFLGPKRPPVPKVSNPRWVRDDIDAFILARLDQERIAPAPEADRATLIRRLSLDLLGLPPAPPEVDDFLKDTRPDAYERLVDRLLASPHYGERWGRHWLDLARYADSDGYEKDTGRPHAWRYRHWVINALNRDLPFDEFTIEQLAGDLLPAATEEQKIATGFHRNTLTNKEGGVDPEQFRVEAVVDRVNTTATIWLGLTLGCARCHDHKFDPFSQREYYQLFAFFNSDQEVNIPAPLPGELEPYQKKKAAFDKKKAELEKATAAYKKEQLPAKQQKWESELKLAELRALPANITAILLIEPAKRNDKQRQELTDFYTKQDKELAGLNKTLAEFQKQAPSLSMAQTLALGPARKTHVMIRGDFLRPGVEVEPGTPAVLPSMRRPGRQVAGLGTAGLAGLEAVGASEAGTAPNRLDLARWLVEPDNPLTARVTMNWMWEHYFGRGIVATPEDFGTQGERPSHPELLDWLATEFMRQKWSMKAMHRLILTSATYRQLSKARPELLTRDPLNILLARQNRSRLEAEIVRDVALAASGLLNRTIGGKSVHPPQPAGISELTYAGSARWVESTGPDRYHRGMYTWFQRTSPYPMLMTFDAPDSNVCLMRRERSNTPLQALTLLNDTMFVECAQALGCRALEEKLGSPLERIRYAFRLCLAREPTAAELERLGRLFADFLQASRAQPEAAAKLIGKWKPAGVDAPEAAAWVALARTIMNLDEFVTRE